jgi:hypothetical protein
MNNLRRLGVALTLTLILGVSAFACETPAPGQIQTPPCAAASPIGESDNPIVPAKTLTPREPSAETVASVAKVAISLFESLLPLL